MDGRLNERTVGGGDNVTSSSSIRPHPWGLSDHGVAFTCRISRNAWTEGIARNRGAAVVIVRCCVRSDGIGCHVVSKHLLSSRGVLRPEKAGRAPHAGLRMAHWTRSCPQLLPHCKREPRSAPRRARTAGVASPGGYPKEGELPNQDNEPKSRSLVGDTRPSI